MSIVSSGRVSSSSSESSAEPDRNLLDCLVDNNEDDMSNVSDLSGPREDRYGDEFYVPDVSDKNWAYGDLGHTAKQTSASFLPDYGCSTHLQQYGIILDSTLFSGCGVLDSSGTTSGGINANFWEEHDSSDQFLKRSSRTLPPRREDPISPGSKLQARTIDRFPRRPSMLMPKLPNKKAPAGFLKRILKRAKPGRTSGGLSGS
jgi:hypothetical protein